ncbi:MAG TPA: precorrin-3B C(17)-methyltransferase [Deltaproteobacteria bacterium]|nr:precorrin-3B C(17)-methyltransferase [Deltaproteobacteria bacterium]
MRSSSDPGSRPGKVDSAKEDIPERHGSRSPGTLKVIGLGPGNSDYLAPSARHALKEADVIVGYKGYIELIDTDILQDKNVISTGMRGEIERCLKAIDAAMAGKKTVVVSSGDPGIYGMAGLVMELLHEKNLLHKVEVEIIPGIPALSAAASLLGAPLMHDFAVVSLSDLLTPWEVIKKRLITALEADFVIVIYNPRSRKRGWQLSEALKLVIEYRGGAVPVGIVRNAARTDQQVSVVRADQVDAESIDMLTILFVGNSKTRQRGEFMVTPRGYLDKYGHR